MENKKSFVLYIDNYEAIKELSVEEKAELLDAIFLYHINPENPVGSLGLGAKIVLKILIAQFKRDNEKYQRVVERNRKNGLKHVGKKTHRNPKEPKKPDSDSDNENDKKNIFLKKSPEIEKSESNPITPEERQEHFNLLSQASEEDRRKGYGK